MLWWDIFLKTRMRLYLKQNKTKLCTHKIGPLFIEIKFYFLLGWWGGGGRVGLGLERHLL